jgi:hypothetical protein
VEILFIGIAIAVVFGLALLAGQMSLNKPVNTWTDEQLAKRLSYYQGVVARKFQAGQFDEESGAKIKQIEAEIAVRKPTRMAEALGGTIQELETRKAHFQAQGMSEKAALDAVMEEWRNNQRSPSNH